jgi:hypothetical protein
MLAGAKLVVSCPKTEEAINNRPAASKLVIGFIFNTMG